MKIEHNKLIRDNIPAIISKAGKQYKIHKLNEHQYQEELKKKLVEEAREVVGANNRNEIIEELADVLEIYEALIRTYDLDESDIKSIKDKKAKKNGKFDKKIFLEYVIEE